MNSKGKKKDGMTRRDFIKVAGTAGAVGALTLAGPGIPFIHAKEKVTLRFLNSETDADCVKVMAMTTAEYEKKTGVKVLVDTLPAQDAFSKLTASIKGGMPYDMSCLIFMGDVLLLARDGHLVPVTSLTKKYKWGPRILIPYKNEEYWYPYDYNLCTMFYRKDLYQQKGLKVPNTWDQLVENCKALMLDENKDGVYERHGIALPIGTGGPSSYMSFAFLWAEGVKILDDNWKVVFDSPEMGPKVIKFLDFFAELYKTMPPGMTQIGFAPPLTLFASEKITHTVFTGKICTHIDKFAPKLADKYAMTPYMDSKGVSKAVSFGYDGWVVVKTKYSEESMKFMEWFTENHYIDFLHSSPLGFQPPRMDMYDDPRWRANPMIEKYWWAMQAMWDYLKDPNLVIASIDTQGPYMDVRGGKIFNSFALPEMLQNKLLKKMSSNECLKIAADTLRKSLA